MRGDARPAVMRGLALAMLVALAPPAAARDGTPGAESPDGRLRAWIKPVPGEPGASGEHASAVWLSDRRTGRSRELFHGTASRDPKQNRTSLADPHFSLDGGFVYVEADAYATSPAIHQINVRTGNARYVADGGLIGVLREGPWRGYLIVQQHRYRSGGGSFDPIAVVRPDGRRVADIPGSDAGDGQAALDAWLSAKHWTLS